MKKNIILFSLMVAGSAVAAPQSSASANKGVKVFVSGFAGLGIPRTSDSQHSMHVYLTDVHRAGTEDYVKAHEKDEKSVKADEKHPAVGDEAQGDEAELKPAAVGDEAQGDDAKLKPAAVADEAQGDKKTVKPVRYSREELIKQYGQANEFGAFLPGAAGKSATFVKDHKPVHEKTTITGKVPIAGVSTEVYFFHMDNLSVGAAAGFAMPFGGVKEESEHLSFTRKSSVAPSVGLSLMYTHGRISIEGAMFAVASKEVFKVDALKRGALSDKEIDVRVARFKADNGYNDSIKAGIVEKTGEELKRIFKEGAPGESSTNWGVSLGLRVVATMRVLENTHLGAGVSYVFARDFAPGKSSNRHASYASGSSRDRTNDVLSIGAKTVKRPGVFSVMLFAKQQVK